MSTYRKTRLTGIIGAPPLAKAKSIRTKLLLPLIGIAILLNVSVLLICTMVFDRFMERHNIEALVTGRKVIEGQIDDRLLLAGQAAMRIAHDDEFQRVLASGAADEVERILWNLANESKADICLLTDETGKMLARIHGGMGEGAIGDYHTVRAALEGKYSTVIGGGHLIRLSLSGGAPVYGENGDLIGTVTIGFRVDDEDYVDKAKKITGHEIEVFLGDECISSTFIDGNGGRAIGTRADPDIAATVLAGGEHIGQAKIHGEDFLVRYSPLRDGDEPIGMLFSGISVSAQDRAIYNFLRIGILVSLAVFLVIVLLVYRVVENISRPIHELTLDFEQVANTGASILEHRIPPSNIAEINILQNALCKMLEQINRGYYLQLKNKETEVEKERILAASQAKNLVFASISHEIRTPMNAILGISDILLSEGGLNATQEEYILNMKVSAKALLEIVNEVLDLSKLEAGKMQLKPVDYNFKVLLDGVCSLATYLAEEKGLYFDLSVEGDIPECLYGDDVRLRQVLVNLLGNAVKFTKRGKIELHLRVGGDSLRFVVSDTGIGIQADKMHHLFAAFETVDEEATRRKNGTGLGLPICKGLVELMGGSLLVESEYGRGSVFTLTIPKILGDAAKMDGPDEGDGEAVALDGNARILVVDDNSINLNVACGLIRSMYGIRCDTAESGLECVYKAGSNVYDLIFMDHMMPGMDGVETTVELRKKGGYLADVPIIALTANAVNGMRDVFLANGMNGFLSKPIIKKDLQKVMRSWLGREEKRERRHLARPVGVPATLEGVPGLDVAEGVEYNAGRMDVYLKSLRILREMIPGFVGRVRELSGADNLRELSIHIHGMKSSLAGVGAAGLSSEFLLWERTFLDGRLDDCRKSLPGLIAELEDLRGDLVSVPLDKEAPDIRMGLYNLDEELEALRAALVAYDYEAVGECTRRLRQIIDETNIAINMAEITARIEQFDYEGALAQLEEANACGVKLPV